jgi:hypothetical protein
MLFVHFLIIQLQYKKESFRVFVSYGYEKTNCDYNDHKASCETFYLIFGP